MFKKNNASLLAIKGPASLSLTKHDENKNTHSYTNRSEISLSQYIVLMWRSLVINIFDLNIYINRIEGQISS